MPLRTRLFIIISIVVLLILGISLFLLIGARKKTATVSPGTAIPSANQNVIESNNFNNAALGGAPSATVTPTAPISAAASSLDLNQNTAKQLAKLFAERYGTYSSDNNAQNIAEVKNLVTPDFWTKLNSKTPAAGGPFIGVTTQVVSVNLTSWQDSAASVEIKSIRITEQGGATTQKQQGAKISLVKQNSSWLVAGFEWEK